jgi:hypothetical protein
MSDMAMLTESNIQINTMRNMKAGVTFPAELRLSTNVSTKHIPVNISTSAYF